MGNAKATNLHYRTAMYPKKIRDGGLTGQEEHQESVKK